jgi:biotin carboxyl carrier protein
MKFQVTVAGRSFDIEVDHDQLVRVDGRPLYVDLEQVGGLPVYSLALDDDGYVVFVEEGQTEYHVEVKGQVFPVDVRPQRPQLTRRKAACSDGREACLVIRAPLAGTLVSLPVAIGDAVEAGQVIAVVESMKMQMELKAPQPGLIEAIEASPGQDVGQGETLVTIRTG